jgi:hypothetical protein
MNYNQLAKDIHEENINAGWWSDLETGESTLATRNRGEMLMLAVTELTEADTARGPDDKLPDLQGRHVELADCAIRILDQGAADGVDWDTDCHLDEAQGLMLRLNMGDGIMAIVNQLSFAMEAWRKRRLGEYREHLVTSLVGCEYLYNLGPDKRYSFLDIIQMKREFNSHRADHKIENRKAEGGKKC